MSVSWTKKVAASATALLAVVMISSCGAAASTPPTAGGQQGGAAGGSGDKVVIGIGGQPALTYLPTTLAAQLGYYKDEGLNVELQDLQGGSKALTALIGGSVQVTSGYYEHTIQMQAKDQSIESFVQMGKSPGLVLVVAPGKTNEIKSLKDLKGKTVGVTAPGSSTDMMVRYLLSKNGMQPTDVSIAAMGAGSSAVAAMESGQVDAGVMLEPDVSVLAKKSGKPTTSLADVRTVDGLKSLYGSDAWPSSCLYSKTDWIQQHPETAQKLANAITKTLKYIATHDGKDIASKMPAAFSGGDMDLYAKLIDGLKPQLTADGMNTEAGANAVLNTQRVANPAVGQKQIDLSKTYTNKFVGGQ